MCRRKAFPRAAKQGRGDTAQRPPHCPDSGERERESEMPREQAQCCGDDGGVPAAFLCPILQDVMRDPVFTARAPPRERGPIALSKGPS